LDGKQIPDRITSILLPLITLFIISGFYACDRKIPGSEEINQAIKVFGVQLFSEADYKDIKGIIPSKEPCTKGFEYIYDSLDISIGYSFKGYIRKITSLNKSTSMFDIHIGDSFQSGTAKILKSGFKKSEDPYSFVKDWCSFTLLVNEQQKVFGMRVEVLD